VGTHRRHGKRRAESVDIRSGQLLKLLDDTEHSEPHIVVGVASVSNKVECERAIIRTIVSIVAADERAACVMPLPLRCERENLNPVLQTMSSLYPIQKIFAGGIFHFLCRT